MEDGLWPDYDDGTWPACCRRTNFNEKEVSFFQLYQLFILELSDIISIILNEVLPLVVHYILEVVVISLDASSILVDVICRFQHCMMP